MKVDLSEFKKNIISWYPINKKETVLQIGENVEIYNELKRKTDNVLVITNIEEFEIKAKFDFVTIIGEFENINSEEEIVELLEFAKKALNKDGKILLALKNKFGMKYWSGERFSSEFKAYETIEFSKENVFSYTKIKSILENLKVKYKFYYPLPDFNITNVIYTDEFMPNNESIDSRVLTCCENEEILGFSERNAYKQILENDEKLFPFFANSFFIEISEKNNFSDIKYVSYSITRNKEYRIKTIIGKDYVYKMANGEIAQNHIKNIERNIKILNKCKIETLDKYEDSKIISKYLKDAKSFDKLLVETFEKDELSKVIEKINIFKKEVIDKLEIQERVDKTVFDKYGINLDEKLKEKMHFTQNGVLDLIFQNCLVKNNKLFIYDQEWYEENVPIEFILFRALYYVLEIRNDTYKLNLLYKEFGLEEFEEIFIELEEKLQQKIVNKDMWELHSASILNIGRIEEYEKRLNAAEEHIENLENNIKEYEKGIADLTQSIKNKDIELVNYANQLRTISNSLSWKITKPLRILSWVLNPKSGASFIDRIMPPGGKRRLKYEEKKQKKIAEKKTANYFKLTDKKTAEYWKKLDDIQNKKIEKYLENEEELLDYEKWYLKNIYTINENQENEKVSIEPKISILVSLYNPNVNFFRELLYSIHSQSYSNWELCVIDGSETLSSEIKSMIKKEKRIKYKSLLGSKNVSENLNSAIELASGEYITWMNQSDILEKNSLYEVAKSINNTDSDVIYTDEDRFIKLEESFFEPNFKPDFSIDMFRAVNYIGNLCVLKKTLINDIGNFDVEFEGLQDFDMLLRACEKTNKITHIPKILYHLRVQDKEILFDKKIIENHLKRIGLKGKVYQGIKQGTYEIEYEVNGNPKVSIIIPNKDGKDILKKCIESILEKTTYKNYEIVIVENNSESNEIYKYYEELLKNKEIRILNYNTGREIINENECNLEFTNSNKIELKPGFNYSAIINFGVRNSKGDYIIQLNNDTELLTSNWIEKMLGFCQREDVGAVGVKLYYPDETIQHAGIIVGCLRVAAHMFRGIPKASKGYMGRENLIQNLNAVTAACIMTKKSIYEDVGFMNEDFAVAFNDVDFCLKIRQIGKLIVYNPYIEFIHYESKTRGNDLDPDKVERFEREIQLFLDTWKNKLLVGDEYYNKNLSLNSEQYEIKTEKVE